MFCSPLDRTPIAAQATPSGGWSRLLGRVVSLSPLKFLLSTSGQTEKKRQTYNECHTQTNKLTNTLTGRQQAADKQRNSSNTAPITTALKQSRFHTAGVVANPGYTCLYMPCANKSDTAGKTETKRSPRALAQSVAFISPTAFA
ncbi:hypothetical protein C0Q70_19114 [Pomacea canaliculata]|uniref:Uncharacterized protein n=1 Tax=Pomacea canaliculata TaxID=400727 RepID=A0A2T7NIF0_POMCA|nr:hypothetical protein C0Q70_19114 [Pomacea canaliculata]